MVLFPTLFQQLFLNSKRLAEVLISRFHTDIGLKWEVVNDRYLLVDGQIDCMINQRRMIGTGVGRVRC